MSARIIEAGSVQKAIGDFARSAVKTVVASSEFGITKYPKPLKEFGPSEKLNGVQIHQSLAGPEIIQGNRAITGIFTQSEVTILNVPRGLSPEISPTGYGVLVVSFQPLDDSLGHEPGRRIVHSFSTNGTVRRQVEGIGDVQEPAGIVPETATDSPLVWNLHDALRADIALRLVYSGANFRDKLIIDLFEAEQVIKN